MAAKTKRPKWKKKNQRKPDPNRNPFDAFSIYLIERHAAWLWACESASESLPVPHNKSKNVHD